MKKNGFTLVELIAVLVILSIIGMLAVPNIMNLMQNGKEKSFITDVEEMVSTATYMYKKLSIRDSSIGVNNPYMIYMNQLTGNIPELDPYGYTYDTSQSYISFIEPNESSTTDKRIITVHIKSCKGNKCHYVCSADGNNLSTNDIKDNCS